MILLAIIEYAILASTFTIAKVAIGYADPLFIIGVRMVASSPIMFLIHHAQAHSSFRIDKRDRMLFVKAGLFHIFLPFVGEFWALQYISSAKTAIVYSLTPFIAALLSFLLLKKALSSKQALGLITGLLGLMPIFFSGDQVAHAAGEFLRISLPELVLLGSVVSASYAWFIVSDLMQRGYGISLINGIAMLIGGLLAFILWLFIAEDHDPLKGDMASFVLWTSLLILVANVISYNLYGWLLRFLSINFMSAIGFLCPIFASLYGAIFLGEELGFGHLASLSLVITGLWLFYREEIKRSSPRQPT